MLNISNKDLKYSFKKEEFKTFRLLSNFRTDSYSSLVRFIMAIILLMIAFLFVPWTQNVRSIGNVIALNPDQRPQTIQSVIAGRIDKWYVKEGQFVQKGDTILKITEIKDDYFDPDLLKRTELQIDAKSFTQKSYQEKADELDKQIRALQETRDLKLAQNKNKIKQNQLKITSDSIDLEAAKLNYQVAKAQFLRIDSLYQEGLRSLTDTENRKLKYQEAQAKLIAQENKLLAARNDLYNSLIELESINAEANDKIAKSRSEKYSALSGVYDSEASINKLENQFSNYKIRNSLYYILAPQDGYITEAQVTGIGENIKEGQELITIMPANYTLAIEMFIQPIDLPLFEKKQKVMIQFDGWPAIIFSGWPVVSYGTYTGEVLAMDNFIGKNNLYRILVKPKEDAPEWPTQLRVGAGVKTITLLKTVPLWYELWRQVNGFPPDYYKIHESGMKNNATKK